VANKDACLLSATQDVRFIIIIIIVIIIIIIIIIVIIIIIISLSSQLQNFTAHWLVPS